jgi:hypothetical protein
MSIPILYLWETDILDNFEMCEKLILEFIESCGTLDNYHSFNYFVEDNMLALDNSILIPYFEQ